MKFQFKIQSFQTELKIGRGAMLKNICGMQTNNNIKYSTNFEEQITISMGK
jgi:hypothetical protein